MVVDADRDLRCPTCGKHLPVNLATCPDDGTLLASRTKGESADTTFGSDTSIDIGTNRESDTGTSPFDPFSSDARTYLIHRPQFDAPELPPGAKSSDPPTSFIRRAVSHIELPPGSLVDDAYEIDHRLGAGAMGEVYAARHLKLGKRVAIKAISPRLSEDTAAVERFAQEARTLAQMHHPGLVDVLGFGELADGRAYFVMEYLSGESLFDRLQHGRLDRDDALDVFAQMARALEAAHMHGVVHRDLKPENVFLVRVTNEPRPIVKLLDFGLARLQVEVDQRTERTQSGVVIGTAMYLSPEQTRGPDVDGRTDVYSLGCIGYELFLGRHPFEDARTIAALIAAHMHDTPPLPRSIDPGIPAHLDLMLFAMLAKDPHHRPTLPQIRSVVEGMRSADATLPVAPVRAATVPSAPPSNGRRAIAGAVAVLALGVVIGAAFRGSSSDAGGPATSAIPHVVDGGDALAPVPPAVHDAPLVDLAATPSTSMDAGAVRPRVATVSHHGWVAADAAIVSTTRPIDATPVPDSEATVDAGTTRPAPLQPAPPPGYLKILAPSGAQIFVDGMQHVVSASMLALAPGKHRIQFVLGSNKDSFFILVESGESVTLDKRDLYQARSGSNARNQTINPFTKKPAPR